MNRFGMVRLRVVALSAAAALAALLAPSVVWADVADAVWNAMKERSILVERTNGADVAGKLLGVEKKVVVVVLDDGTPVTVNRADVRAVRLRVVEPEPPPAALPPPPEPPASSPPPAPPAPPAPHHPLKLAKLLGRQAVLTTTDGRVIEGKLVELDGTKATIEQDDGAQVTIESGDLASAKRRFVTPVGPAPSTEAGEEERTDDSAQRPRRESDDAAPHDGRGRSRTFGIGSAIGGGFSGADQINPALLLPTLEFQLFSPNEYSLDVTIPVFNTIVFSALSGGFLFNTDFFFNANVGSGTARFIIGPGLGFAVATAGTKTAGALRLPAQLGVEFLSSSRRFGFKILTRPWVEVGSAGVGGGMLGMFVFSGYGTRAAPRSTDEPSRE